MSEPENLDLSALDLMPSWVTDLEKPSSRFQDHETGPEKPRGKEGRRTGDFRGGDRDDRRGGRRPGRDRSEDRDRDRRGRGEYRGGDRDRHGTWDRDRDRRGRGDYRDRDRDRFDSPKPADPIPPVEASLAPAPFAVDALARHIRSTGRAYPMADVAKMILGGRDRYQIKFQLKNPGRDSLYLCDADQSLWISKEEAIQHVLNGSVLRQYYDIEEVALDPPRGNYAVVAVCGMSGRILGPPNHHQYQQNLVHLHRERFSHMPLERYKSRIEMRRDEETIEKWKQQVSKAFHYRLRTGAGERPGESASATAKLSPPKAEGPPANAAGQETPEIGLSDGNELESAAETVQSEPEFGPEEAFAPGATGEEETAEVNAGEAPEEAPILAEAADSEEQEAEPANSPKKGETGSCYFESKEALARHFREHIADEVIQAVSEATVSGDIPGKNLSRGLLNCLKNESDRHRRGFPLELIQKLCGEFEARGLRFFKRDRRNLYVSVARPRPIKDEELFTDRVRRIVAFVRSHPRARVADLLNALVTDYQKNGRSETFQEHHLTQAEHDVLADLRWLTMEGYVIEYPDTGLMLGRAESPSQPQPAPAAKKKAGSGKTGKGKLSPESPNPAEASAEEAKAASGGSANRSDEIETAPVEGTPVSLDKAAPEPAGDPLPASAISGETADEAKTPEATEREEPPASAEGSDSSGS